MPSHPVKCNDSWPTRPHACYTATNYETNDLLSYTLALARHTRAGNWYCARERSTSREQGTKALGQHDCT